MIQERSVSVSERPKKLKRPKLKSRPGVIDYADQFGHRSAGRHPLRRALGRRRPGLLRTARGGMRQRRWPGQPRGGRYLRSEEHTSELQSRPHLVCRLLLEKKNKQTYT